MELGVIFEMSTEQGSATLSTLILLTDTKYVLCSQSPSTDTKNSKGNKGTLKDIGCKVYSYYTPKCEREARRLR